MQSSCIPHFQLEISQKHILQPNTASVRHHTLDSDKHSDSIKGREAKSRGKVTAR